MSFTIRRHFARLLILSAITSFYFCGPSFAQQLSREDVSADIDFIVEKLQETHPAPDIFPDLAALEFPVGTIRQRDFFFTVQKAIAQMRDSHTELMYDGELLMLPFKGVWRKDGYAVTLALAPEAESLVGSNVTAIEGVTMENWFDTVASLVSREPVERVYAAGEKYLRWLPAVEKVTGKSDMKSATVSYIKNGESLEAVLPFLPYRELENGKGNQGIETSFWEILSTGYIRFDYCSAKNSFLNEIQEFIYETEERGLRNMVIDLRYNGGGSTDFVSEFLMHMPGRDYRYYTVIGPGEYKKVESSPPEPKSWNLPVELNYIDPFSGDVFVLTGPETFSSATFFASVMRENGLAIIVGEPTGSAPCAFGHSTEFPLPHGKFRLRVATKYFIRPTGACGGDSLKPHVNIPTTAKDFLSGNDPVMEWLKNNLNRFL